MQNIVRRWLLSFEKKAQPPMSSSLCIPWEQMLDMRSMKKLLRSHLQALLKEKSSLSPVDRLYLEDFLKALGKKSPSHFLHQFFTLEKALAALEERLEALQQQLSQRPFSSGTELEALEETLRAFHRECGQTLQQLLTPPLSDKQQAIKWGQFRKKFQELNDLFGNLKQEMLGKPVDAHLFCLCHFSGEPVPAWPFNTKVVDLKEESSETKAARDLLKASLLIFTCRGGSGHISATQAMGQNAAGDYHVCVANTLEETLAANDILKKLRFNLSQEQLYNYLLKNEHFGWLKIVTSIGPFFLQKQKKQIEKLILLEALRHAPDILISCIPILNPMFLNVARSLSLPLLIVTTDLDARQFVRGMKKSACDLSYPHYRITLAYENSAMRKIVEARIPKDKIHVSGFPLRPAFNRPFSHADIAAFRQETGIERRDKVILIMMGGLAGLSTEYYARLLAQFSDEEVTKILLEDVESTSNVHVICLCGSEEITANREMRQRIQSLAPKSSLVKIRAMPATSKISLLMSSADVLITKPGGGTSNEALSKNLPIIFHAPFALMGWERFNMEFCIRAGFGVSFSPLIPMRRFSLRRLLIKLAIRKEHALGQPENPRIKGLLLQTLRETLRKKEALQRQASPLVKKDFKTEFLGLLDFFLR